MGAFRSAWSVAASHRLAFVAYFLIEALREDESTLSYRDIFKDYTGDNDPRNFRDWFSTQPPAWQSRFCITLASFVYETVRTDSARQEMIVYGRAE